MKEKSSVLFTKTRTEFTLNHETNTVIKVQIK